MLAHSLLLMPLTIAMGGTVGYTVGSIIALLILGYLVYSLIKPEKF